MSGNTVDQALIQITGSAVPRDVDDVINVMEALDAALPGVIGRSILLQV